MAGLMPEWVAEMGLGPQVVVLDLGACPWCGRYEIHVAQNGRAVGRKPPADCCVFGALAEMGRVQKALRFSKDPHELAELRSDLRRVQEVVRSFRVGREELEGALQAVRERGIRVDLSLLWRPDAPPSALEAQPLKGNRLGV